MNAAEFLVELFGREPNGWTQIWRLATKSSSYYRSPGAVRLGQYEPDVYFGLGLAGAQLRRTERAKIPQIVGIPGLWLDLDVDGGPQRKRGGVPTQHNAGELAASRIEPTMLLDSGYGVHAYYLFNEGPWRFRKVSERAGAQVLARKFYALHAEAAERMGWGLDTSTHDLTRVLRLPGTLNVKDPERPRPVEVITADGPRHSVDALEDLVAGVEDLQAVAPSLGGAPGQGGAELDADRLQVTAASGQLPDWLDVVFENSPEIGHVFHAPPGSLGFEAFSASEMDLSLASHLAYANHTTTEIAEAIVLRRLHHDPGDTKHKRRKYLLDTIARARTTSMTTGRRAA